MFAQGGEQMKRTSLLIVSFAIAAVVAGAFWAACRHGHPNPNPGSPEVTNTGGTLTFPVPESQLLAIRDNADQAQAVAGLNDHAWMIFKGLAGTDSDPIWKNWCAVSDTDLIQGKRIGVNLICPDPESVLNTPDEKTRRTKMISRLILGIGDARQLIKGHPDSTLGTGLATFESSEVLFDPDTAHKIVDCFSSGASELNDATGHPTGLNEAYLESSKLSDVKPDCRAQSRSGFPPNPNFFGALPNSSRAIKTIWAVTSIGSSSQGHHLTDPIPIWNSSAPPAGGTGFASVKNKWLPRAMIDVDDTGPCNFAPIPASQKAIRLPLNCFYSFVVTSQEMNDAVATVKNHVKIQPTGSGKVYLILLGFHAATKEIKNWTWQTYWWNGGALTSSTGEEFKNPPTTGSYAITDPRWAHYVMRTTLGGKTSPPQMMTSVAASPYLEGPMGPNATQSNCMNCHQLAVFHKTLDGISHGKSPREYFDAANDCGKNSPCSIYPVGSQSWSDYFQGSGTDFLWSLADSNAAGLHGHPVNSFLTKVNHMLFEIESEKYKLESGLHANRVRKQR
jgi:hypothetical protein